MIIRSILRVIALTVVACAFALVVSTCGGSGKRAVVQGLSPGSSPEDKTSPEGLDYQEPVSLDDALAELDAYPCPDGVDAALFAELKDALGEALTTTPLIARPGDRASSLLNPEWGSPGHHTLIAQPGDCASNVVSATARFVSTPPTGEENRVDDLAFSDDGEGNLVLTWHYRNLGDYDQNGTVGISDITPIAMHYGETYDIANENCLLAVIDGSGNGEIDIADITPIAMYYAVDIASYSVRSSAHEWGAYTEIDAIGFEEATGGDVGRKVLELPLVPELGTWYRVVPQDGAWNEGVVSDAVQFVGEVPPEIVSVSPLSGTTNTEAQFFAIVTGQQPMTFAWDFGGGADPNTSNEATPTVTLGAPDVYECILTAANAYGYDTLEFTLTVVSETTFSVSGTVSRAGGGDLSGAVISLDDTSSVETDTSGYYEFTGVASGNHTLAPSLNGWTFDPPVRNLDVEDTDVHLQDFTAYSAPVAQLTADPEIGDAPLEVAFDASASYDPDGGSIVKYEWDWESDGTYDQDSGEESTVLHTYDSAGAYAATVRVHDDETATDTASILVTVYGAWHIEAVDSDDDVGRWCSLALDSMDRPHISYRDDTHKHLKYAHHDGSYWLIGTVDDVYNTGAYTSIEIDSSDDPRISYWGYPDSDLLYVYYDGSHWNKEVADGGWQGLGSWSSLELDATDRPHISHFDYSNNDLKYTYYDGMFWRSEVIDSEGTVGYHCSLALDSSDHPHVAYQDSSAFEVNYAYHDGVSWNIEAIGEGGENGRYTSIVVDSSSHPHITYRHVDDHYLMYAYYSGPSWEISRLCYLGPNDPGLGVEFSTSIVLDSSGNPHVSFFYDSGENLRYMYHDGSSWRGETVDSEGNVGMWSSLALDSSDRPHIAYWDYTHNDLKYAIYY